MFVTLAVYSGNADTALELLRWITEIGGVNHRQFFLFYTPQTNPAPLIEEANKAWGGVQAVAMHVNQESLPWPRGNNAAFLAVCRHMNGLGQPFLFLEPDVLPLGPGWMDALEAEYQMTGMPFMGDVHAMYDRENKVIPDTMHMNGAGIYPSEVIKFLPSLIWLDSIYAGQPWDVALRFEMLHRRDLRTGEFSLQNGQRIPQCHATRRICFCWRSTNYRLDPQGGLHWQYDLSQYGMPKQIDFAHHVLHHGCKDGSLLDLLRRRLRMMRGNPVAPIPELLRTPFSKIVELAVEPEMREFGESLRDMPPLKASDVSNEQDDDPYTSVQIAAQSIRDDRAARKKKRSPGRPKKRGPKKGTRRKAKASATVNA